MFLGLVAGMATSATAQTAVSGEIATTTWTALGSPYVVTGVATVPAGVTLTIEAGAEVQFEAEAGLAVSGSLLAEGATGDSIRFIGVAGAGWRGLHFTGDGGGVLSYARVDGATFDPDPGVGGNLPAAVNMAGSQVDIDHSVLTGSLWGIILYSGKLNTDFTTVVENSSYGVGLFAESDAVASLKLVRSTIAANAYGVTITGRTSSIDVTINSSILHAFGGVAAIEGLYSLAKISYSDITQPFEVMPGRGNINADPQFTDAAGGDFTLTSTSPCINSGDPWGGDDPDGTRADIGAGYYDLTGVVTTTGTTYIVDKRGGERAYVIAYDELSYSVDGGSRIDVPGPGVAKADIAGASGAVAKINLSSDAGYVVTIADSADYVSDNSSNDNMILARGRNGFVDTEFLVFNHVRTVNAVNPGKIVITSPEAEATVTITDLTDGTDTHDPITVERGNAKVIDDLTHTALLRIVSDQRITVYYGILADGHTEVMPVTNGGFVGTEAFVATPKYLGIVSLGKGDVRVFRQVFPAGSDPYEENLFSTRVDLGQGVFLPNVRFGATTFGGVEPVRVTSTAPFYVYAGIGGATSWSLGSTFIPPDPDSSRNPLSTEALTDFYVQSIHSSVSTIVEVIKYEVGTSVNVQAVGGNTILHPTDVAGTTAAEIETYTLPASVLTTSGGIVNKTWRITTNKPVAVRTRLNRTVEQGGIVLTPEYVPASAPGAATMGVTAVHLVPDAGALGVRTEYLQLDIILSDVNGDMTDFSLTDPASGAVTIPEEFIARTPDDLVGPWSRIEIATGELGLPFAYQPGTYTLTATDAGGRRTVRESVVRDFTDDFLAPAGVGMPDIGTKFVELSPVYAWIPPLGAYASRYSVQVSSVESFASGILHDFGDVSTQTTNLAQATATDTLLREGQTYYWRVMSKAMTLQYGADVAVVGPTWNFSTAADRDSTAPEFMYLPRVIASSADTVTIQWTTDEPTVGSAIYGRRGWSLASGSAETPLGSVQADEFLTGHIATFIVRDTVSTSEGTRHYDLEVVAIDAQGNVATSDRTTFRTMAERDSKKPEFTFGPELVSSTRAKIRLAWGSDEPTVSLLSWYPDGVNPNADPDSVDELEMNAEFTLAHEAEIGGLRPDTQYNFEVSLLDRSGNPQTSRVLPFRTRLVADGSPPRIIGGVSLTTVGVDRAVIEWRTNERCYGSVLFGTAPGTLDRSRSAGDDVLRQNHRIELRDLAAATQYWYAARSIDAARLESTSDEYKFGTRAKADTVSPPIYPLAAGALDRGSILSQNAALGRPSPQAFWFSNELNNGNVEVSTDPLLGDDLRFKDRTKVFTYASPDLAKEHTVDLTDLSLNTQYYVMIIATDRFKNTSMGEIMNLRTPKTERVDDVAPRVETGRSTLTVGRDQAAFHIAVSEPAEVRIVYGTAPAALTSTVSSLGRSREHDLLLPALAPGTRYFYQRGLIDAAGNKYADTGKPSFQTPTTADTQPPQFVVGPSVPYATSDRALFVWQTDEATNGAVYYRRAGVDEYAEFVNSRVLSTSHSVLVTGLDKGQPYDFAMVITDAVGLTTKFPDNTTIVKDAIRVRLIKSARGAGRLDGGTFTTAISPDVSSPVITSGPVLAGLNKSTALISWETDEPSDSRVRFEAVGSTTAKLSRAAFDTLSSLNEVSESDQATSHIMTIDVGAASGTYTYQALSRDPSGNETISQPLVFTVTSEEDVLAPTIIDGPDVISKTDTRAVVRWVTNEASDSRIDIRETGQELDEQRTVSVSDHVTEHVMTLTNLTSTTSYLFQVSSTDAYKNGPAMANAAFETAAGADVTAPTITVAPELLSADDVAATIVWRTDEPTDSYIEYGLSGAFGLVAQTSARDTNHALLLTNLSVNTDYVYRVQAEDASGNLFVQPSSATFKTAATADVTPPAVPANLQVFAGDGAAYAMWDENTETDLAGYDIQRSVGDETGYVTIASNLQEPWYLDRDAANGTEHFYRIAAVDNTRLRNESAYTPTSAQTHATPAEGNAPAAPTITDYEYYTGFNGYPVFLYYDTTTGEGEPYRPVLRVPNVPDVAQPGASMSYTFVVATDADFQNILVTGSNIPPGDALIGSVNSWVWSWMRLDSTQRDNTRMIELADSTSWIPTENLTPGIPYYWKVRANDGIFDGPWSSVQTIGESSLIELLDPARAEYLGIQLRPEEAAAEIVAVQLEMFAAAANPIGIDVSWRISDGDEAAGVTLLRGLSPDDPAFTPVTGNLQPMEGRFLDASALPEVTYYYRIEVMQTDGEARTLGLLAARMSAPMEFTLGANHPNPFNPSTVIPYTLPDHSVVTLAIYDATGRQVRTLISQQTQRAGYYRATWDGRDDSNRDVGSGVYLYRLVRTPSQGATPSATRLGRMVLLR